MLLDPTANVDGISRNVGGASVRDGPYLSNAGLHIVEPNQPGSVGNGMLHYFLDKVVKVLMAKIDCSIVWYKFCQFCSVAFQTTQSVAIWRSPLQHTQVYILKKKSVYIRLRLCPSFPHLILCEKESRNPCLLISPLSHCRFRCGRMKSSSIV